MLPLTLVAADDSLHWEALLAERRVALAKADSVLVTLLQARAPEVVWVLPDELRRAARRAPGIVTVVMVDVRTGRVGFRTVARGEGDDPWTALTRAVKSLTPGLP